MAAGCIFYAADAAREWQSILEPPSLYRRMISRGQPVSTGIPVYSGAYQHIRRDGPDYLAQYRFVNFNRDRLWVQFSIPETALNSTSREYGFSSREMDALQAQHENAAALLRQNAQMAGDSPARLDANLQALETDYRKREAAYLGSKGFKLDQEGKIVIDYVTLVHRNAPRLGAVAEAFSSIARQQNYDSDDIIGAATAMVQTSLFYKDPPKTEGDRYIVGLLPPLESLIAGWGDCDTKSGILASVLMNWDRMRAIGVAVPGHYLLGVYRIPRHGDVYIKYGGLDYVLIEPAGPAWLPVGSVGQYTMEMLKRQEVAVDSF